MTRSIFAVVAFFIAGMCAAQAQNGQLNFNIKYMPQATYEMVNKSQTTISITQTPVSKVVKGKAPAKAAAPKPQVTIQKQEMAAQTTIGKPDSSKQCPVTFKLKTLQTTQLANGGESQRSDPLQGTPFYGVLTAAGKIQLDSMDNSNFTADYKKAFLQSFNTVVNQVQLPEKVLHVGESFVQDNTINMPMGNDNMEILVKSTYTLVKLVEHLAYLDIKQVVTYHFNIAKTGGNFNAGGSGNGKMVYNMNNLYADTAETNLALNMTMTQNNLKSVINLNITNLQTASVTKQIN